MSDSYESRFVTDFEVKRIIGEGVCRCVFQAEKRADKREFAVKRIAFDPVDNDDKAKALKEVKAIEKLDHPGVVRCISWWIETPPRGWQEATDQQIIEKIEWTDGNALNFSDGCHFIYLQMELCNSSLKEWLTNNGTIDSREITRMMKWFKQIVTAVAYIHEQGFIHRDLKPSNILFAGEDTLKITDLYFAKDRQVDGDDEHSVTKTAHSGDYYYMSPEQRDPHLSSRISSKSDVFTLGLILAELCVPFKGDAEGEEKRWKFFNCLRRGERSDLIRDPRMAEVIGKLTLVDTEKRPKCKEILDLLSNF